jgi:hypothetical protein
MGHVTREQRREARAVRALFSITSNQANVIGNSSSAYVVVKEHVVRLSSEDIRRVLFTLSEKNVTTTQFVGEIVE